MLFVCSTTLAFIFTPGSSCYLCHQLESTFVRTEIRIIEHGVRVQDAHYTYVVKVQTFRYHLRTDQYVRLSLLKIGDNLLVGSEYG